MKLIPINYNSGQIWVTKERTEFQRNEIGHVMMLSVWKKPIEPKLLAVINRDNNGEYLVRAKRVQGELNHADIDGETWACVSVSDCSSKVIAQSNIKIPLPNIPYVEIEEYAVELAKQRFPDLPFSNNGGYEEEEYKQLHKGIQEQIDKDREIWISGYKAASTKKYTRENLIKAFYAGQQRYNLFEAADYFKEIEPKVVSIEIETKQVCGDMSCLKMELNGENSTCCGVSSVSSSETYQKDGKTFLKIKKVNYEASTDRL